MKPEMKEDTKREGVRYTGVLSREELARVLPDPERVRRGPVAVLECVQEIRLLKQLFKG